MRTAAATILTAALVLLALAYAASDDRAAMAKCQEKHSYDTCFSALHR